MQQFLECEGIIAILIISQRTGIAFMSEIITTILLPDGSDRVGCSVMPLVTFTVFVFAESIQGTSGDDILKGTTEPDTINGLEGNDLILGEAADDIWMAVKETMRYVVEMEVTSPLEMKPITRNEVYGGSGDDNIDAGIDYTQYPILLCVWRSWL